MNEIAHIGSSIHIKGDIAAQEPLTIAGHVTGKIDVSGHALTVTEDARVKADVIAHTIVVDGHVNGRLNADGRIIVRQTATIEGALSAPLVAVHEGALVKGQFEVAGRR